MNGERSSPRTFYMCKGTEGSSGTAARLLHIIAFGGFVDLRMGKKKQKQNQDMNRNKTMTSISKVPQRDSTPRQEHR